MCGRFGFREDLLDSVFKKMEVLICGAQHLTSNMNLSPGQRHWVIYKKDGKKIAEVVQWGVTPSWMQSKKALFNARLETLDQKPTFQKAFRFSRCLIPINGFYEWRQEGSQKKPYFFSRLEEEVFFLAGIYFQEEHLKKTVVVTMKANAWMQDFHHRMPVILAKDQASLWLSQNILLDQAQLYESIDLKHRPAFMQT